MAANYDQIISNKYKLKSGPESDEMAPSVPSTAPVVDQGSYSDIINERYNNKKEMAKSSFSVGTQKNPDTYAKVMDLSKRSALSPEAVEQNQDEVAQGLRMSEDFDRLTKENPRTTAWLGNVNNSAVAHDDLDYLKRTESKIEDMTALKKIQYRFSAGFYKTLSSIAKTPAFLYDIASQGILTDTFRENFRLPERAPEEWRNNMASLYFSDTAEKFKTPESELRWTDELSKGNVAQAGKVMAYHAVESAPQMLALIASAVSGYGAVGLAGAGLSSGAEKASELQQQAKTAEPGTAQDPQLSTINAVVHGGIEAVAENFGTLGLFKGWAGAISKKFGKQTTVEVLKDFLKTVAHSSAGEGIEEGITSLAQDLNDWATGAKSDIDFQKSLIDAVEAAGVGAFAGAKLTGPAATIVGIQRARRVKEVEDAKAFYTELGEDSKESKLRKRSPDIHSEFVAAATKGSPVENVYVDPIAFQEYFQKQDVTPAQAATELGVAKEYNDAVETGESIKVPLSTWVNKFVETDHYKGLENDIKFDQEGMSVNEMKAEEERVKVLAQEAATEAETEAGEVKPPSEEMEAQGEAIQQNITQQLVDAGFATRDAETYSEVFRAFRVLGERTGMKPQELFDKYALRISRGATPEGVAGEVMAVQKMLQQKALTPEGEQAPGYIMKDGERFNNVEEFQQHQLRTNELSGLKNLRAFDEDASINYPTVTAIDMDGLTKLNDELGHAGTNKVMKLMAQVFKRIERENPNVRFYHRHGDEFAARFSDPVLAAAVMKELQDGLDKAVYEVVIDGKKHTRRGIGISFGNGENYESADKEAYNNKAQRLSEGKREPKEFKGKSFRFISIGDAELAEADAPARFVREDQQGVSTTLFQSAVSPLGFYSQLESEVQKMDFKEIPAKDLLNRIKNIQGIKKEELETLGIEEWLKAVEGKVTKDQVLQFIKDNGVKVEQVVLGADYEGSKQIGDLQWSEPKRIDLNDRYLTQDNINNEMEYYTNQPEDAFSAEELAQWKEDAEKEADGDEKKAEELLDEKINEEAEKRATENVESDEYYGARYKVELGDTGFELEGSDEYGWSAENPRTGQWKEYGSNLNEAQIQAMADLIEAGQIEGNLSEAITESDIEWNFPPRNIDEKKLKDATTKSFNKNKTKYLSDAKEYYSDMEWFKKLPKKEQQQYVKDKALGYAEDDATERLLDVENPNNKVIFKLHTPTLEGRIEGNNVKGYTFYLPREGFKDSKFKLEGKTEETAKKEAVKILQDEGFISKKKEPGVDDINAPTGSAKFSRYVVPGGENYREVLLTLPNPKGDFTGGHFQKNVLAHVRLTDRTDGAGRKTLFIEELQSDWHQQGREKGYKSGSVEKLKEQRNEIEEKLDKYTDEQSLKGHDYSTDKFYNDLKSQFDELSRQITDERDAVPDAPFKNTESWAALAMKRMIKMAVEQGYEAVAWSPADVHVERWGTDSVSWVKKEAGESTKGWSVKETPVAGAKSIYQVVDGDGKPVRSLESNGFSTKKAAQDVIDRLSEPHFLVGSAEQRGGNVDGMNIEEVARQRGKLLERNGERVTTKEELRNAIGETLGRERNDRSLDALTERVWKQMQSEEQHTGAVMPRKEGMEFFYNKLIPDVAKKILKKLDPEAKIVIGTINEGNNEAERNESGGLTVTRGPKGMQVLEIPITDTIKEKAAAGFSLFQPGDEGPRGQIRFGDGKFNIELLKNADFSTLLHETGHFYLEVLGDLAQSENAPQQIKDDYATILKWLNVPSRDQIATEHHEQWARGFEAYLMEGKAPTESLRQAFARFKVWLISVYRNLRKLNVELTQDVKNVMNRLLATDEEITQAETQQNIEPLFGRVGVYKMSDELADKYFTAFDQAREAASAQVTAKLMKDYERSRQSFYKEERGKLRSQVEEQLNQNRVYKTIDVLQRGQTPDGTPLKLSKNDLLAMWGSAGFERIKAKKGPYLYSRDGGLHPDVIAPMFGYPDGDTMLTEIANAPDKKDEIERLTDAQMAEKYPDSLTDGSLPQEVIDAVHNDKRAQILRMELEHLASNNMPVLKDVIRRITRRVPSDKIIKDQAVGIIAQKSLTDVRPYTYLLAERKSAKLAGEALAKGDIDQAFEQKQKELLNHELYRAATLARQNIGKQMKFFKRLNRTDEDLAKSRDTDFINAARAILAQFGLSQEENTPDSYLAKVKQYDPDTYNTVNAIVESATANVSFYKDMPYDDFVAMSDAVHALWDLSKTSKEIEIDGKKMDSEVIQTELQNQISFVATPKEKPGYTKAVTDQEKRGMLLLGAAAAMKRVEHWVEAMDVGSSGPFRKYIWNPISEATTKYRLAKHSTMKDFEALVKEIAPRLTYQSIAAPEINYTFRDKTELLMTVLHTGNESNADKLLRGRRWGEIREDGSVDRTQFDKFLNRMWSEGVLAKPEYDFAQKVWDLMESLKPDAQKAHRQMYGYYFSEITFNEIETPFGKYKGGYVPAKVDIYTNEDQAIRQEREEFEKNNNSYQFPTAGRGFTKSRVQQYAAPLSLELSLLQGHIDSVLRFTHIEPRVKEVGRLVINRGFRSSLAQVDTEVAREMLTPWLQRAAQQKVVLPSTSGAGKLLDAVSKTLRRNVAMQFMTANVVNATQQLTGIIVGAVKVKPRHLRSAMASYVTNGKQTINDVLEKSDFMRSIQGSNIYETQETINEIILNPSTFEKIQNAATKHTYFLQTMTQNLVNTVVWTGAYNQSVEQGMTEKEAVRFADSSVRLTQGTMNPEDISRFETGTAFQRLFTQFAGYFNMLANLNASELQKIARESGLKKGAGKAFYLYMMGFMLPAVLAELVVRAASGKDLDEDDDDDYLDDMLSVFFGSQFRTLTAMVPGAGQVVNATVNRFNDNRFDDRLSFSPVISVLESVVGAPVEVYKDISENGELRKQTVRDGLMLLGIASSLPAGPVSKPLGYLMDVQSGEAAPTGPIDFTRGLITGKSGE